MQKKWVTRTVYTTGIQSAYFRQITNFACMLIFDDAILYDRDDLHSKTDRQAASLI